VTTFTSSRRATNARLPHAKRPPPGGYVQTPKPSKWIQVTGNATNQELSRHRRVLAGDKRIYQ
jgi:hypothetical protein